MIDRVFYKQDITPKPCLMVHHTDCSLFYTCRRCPDCPRKDDGAREMLAAVERFRRMES